MTFAHAVLVLGLLAPPRTTLFDTVSAAQRCHTPEVSPGQMDCDFDLGSLHFGIAGVGLPDAGIAVFKADWESDYHLSFGVLHGCLMVSWGKTRLSSDNASENVFISPATGGVYLDWRKCQKAKPKKRK